MQIDTGSVLEAIAAEFEKFLIYGPAREKVNVASREDARPPETSRQRFKAVRHKKRRSR